MIGYFNVGDIFETKTDDGMSTTYRYHGLTQDASAVVIEDLTDGSTQQVIPEWFHLREIYLNGDLLKKFFVPICWEMAAVVPVYACSLSEAMDLAKNISPLPDGLYVDGSIALSCEEEETIQTFYIKPEEPNSSQLPACSCGCTEFYAHQQVYVDVIVDGNNNFLENAVNDNLQHSIGEAENPYGTYQCRRCGKEYDTLDDLTK